MKNFIIVLTICGSSCFAQITKPIHISLVQGISTDGKESKANDYHFSFNLFSGTVNCIKGVEIGTFYNQNEGNMIGYQTSGLVNYTKGTVIGYQNTGLVNISGNLLGVQNSGVANIAQNVIGVQMSGLVNTADEFTGVQISGLFNKVKTLKGIQIGLVNKAENVEKGGGIGLVNLYKNGGYREIEISAADYQNVGLSFKSGVPTFYTILNIGYNFQPTPLLVSGLGIGGMQALKADWFFKPELIWYNYHENNFKFSSSTQSSHLKLGIMKRMGNIAITLSPSVYYANIPKNLEGTLTEISSIKPITQTSKGRFGYGLSLGIGWVK